MSVWCFGINRVLLLSGSPPSAASTYGGSCPSGRTCSGKVQTTCGSLRTGIPWCPSTLRSIPVLPPRALLPVVCVGRGRLHIRLLPGWSAARSRQKPAFPRPSCREKPRVPVATRPEHWKDVPRDSVSFRGRYCRARSQRYFSLLWGFSPTAAGPCSYAVHDSVHRCRVIRNPVADLFS
jgi:hypothetical protein